MIESMILKAKEELTKRPLVAIDCALAAVHKIKSEKQSRELATLLDIFCHAVLKSKELGSETEIHSPSEALFSQDFTRQEQHFIAICLLRLLASNRDCFKDPQFRVKTFELFEEVLWEDLYKHFNIDKKEQSYRKESILRDIVPNMESDLSITISSLSSLEPLSNVRHKVMQKINATSYRPILLPFLPKELLGTRLDEIFKSLEECLCERGPGALPLLEVARYNLRMYILEAENFGTKYSSDYLVGLANKLGELLQKHFAGSPLSKPVALSAEKSEKKYPLHTSDRGFNLGFVIHNPGPGYAFDVSFKLSITDNIFVKNPILFLGDLRPGDTIVEMPSKTIYPENVAYAGPELNWANFDGTTGIYTFECEITAQRRDIDWDALVNEDPYSLEPVTREEELVGRTEILDKLLAKAQASSIGSSYVFGQRRVGKTSIVRTLHTCLSRQNKVDYLPIYLEGGDYISPEAKTTVENLGKTLSKEIQRCDKRFSNIEIPAFDGAFSPLVDFLKSVQQIVPNCRILFILDEFDGLPIDLFKRGPLGDAFFLTLRSISGKRSFGFILVGGERMEFIMSCQGAALNKFQAMRVDYFDKQRDWADFQELVRRPVQKWLEISDEALTTLYDQTSGNPYFTKLICRSLFELMVERRDCHVTRSEIEEATTRTLEQTATNSFQHFWDDGIFVTGEEADRISMDRRRVLLALAETIRRCGQATKTDIISCARNYDLSESLTEATIRDFVRRQVLTLEGDTIATRLPFFCRWLSERGMNLIITTIADRDSILIRKKQEEEDFVLSEEVVALIEKWGIYKGQRITEDKVRTWLNQFGSNSNQRLMFQLLQGVTFYTADTIRAKMKEAHGIVVRGLKRRIEEKKRKRADILVSYIDSVGKSGAHYARLYADENEIYFGNVIERGKRRGALEEKQDLQALVFVDDFIGSGDSACDYFAELEKEFGEVLRRGNLRLFFIVICGFQVSQEKIDSVLSKLNLPVTTHLCDPIGESAKCFGNESLIFSESFTREKAREIAYRHGVNLEKKWPLGWGDCQATVVFDSSCPNNSLPILWATSKNWLPLFKRR